MADIPRGINDVSYETPLVRERIERDFTYHPPNTGQIERMAKIREVAKQLAHLISDNCPPSRETSLAITHLENACFYANASIARNELPK